MRNITVFSLVVSMLVSPLAIANQTLTIADAEVAGFEKRSQQIFQLIDAQDGWSGSWGGETVELYQFASKLEVKPEVFESSVQDGNISGWVELCLHHNMLMLSKGDKACGKLKSMEP